MVREFRTVATRFSRPPLFTLQPAVSIVAQIIYLGSLNIESCQIGGEGPILRG